MIFMEKRDYSRIAVFFLFVFFLTIGLAACGQQSSTGSAPNTNSENTDNQTSVQQAPAAKGDLKLTMAFTPQVGYYQATASGTIDAKAPLNNVRVEVYTKTNGEKKVVAAAKLGNFTENNQTDIEIILSKNRVTYKIGAESDSIQNGLAENQKHALGIDVIAEEVNANWESNIFSFDDSDAFKVAPQ